jgi:uncharacterized protein (TIGR02300 family)
MATKTLGNKFICFMCQCKFYDLGRPESVCPRCGANQKEAPKVKTTPSRARAAERAPREEVYVPSTDDIEVEEAEAPLIAPTDEDDAGDGPEADADDED